MAYSKCPIVLAIAGFDPSAGAGISADLKTIAAHGCYGMAAITSLTVQNTQSVKSVEPVKPQLLTDTLASLAADTEFSVIKIGMLADAAICRVIARFLGTQEGIPVVLDPIIRASSGMQLLDNAGLDVLRRDVLRLTTVITPNREEAEALCGQPCQDLDGMKSSARTLQQMGARNVVITGGGSELSSDFLLTATGEEMVFSAPKIDATSTHGTGCAFSTALACRLAIGDAVKEATGAAKEYVRQAILSAFPIGKGPGPLNHFFGWKRM